MKQIQSTLSLPQARILIRETVRSGSPKLSVTIDTLVSLIRRGFRACGGHAPCVGVTSGWLRTLAAEAIRAAVALEDAGY